MERSRSPTRTSMGNESRSLVGFPDLGHLYPPVPSWQPPRAPMTTPRPAVQGCGMAGMMHQFPPPPPSWGQQTQAWPRPSQYSQNTPTPPTPSQPGLGSTSTRTPSTGGRTISEESHPSSLANIGNQTRSCWECDCQQPSTKKTKCPKGKSFKLLNEENQRYVYVDQEAALSKGYTHPLFEIPGLSSRMIRGDMLHILFCKGVCSHRVGSILKFFIYFDGRGKQSVPPSDRLGMIFKEVQSAYREHAASTRLTNLKLSMVMDAKKTTCSLAKIRLQGSFVLHFCLSCENWWMRQEMNNGI